MTAIMNQIKNLPWRKFFVIAMIAMVAVSFDACKSSGKLSKKEKKAQIAMYKKQMRDIINGTTTLSLEEQDAMISEAINKNFGDEELDGLIVQAQQVTKNAYSEYQKEMEKKVAAARNKLYDLLVNNEGLSADQLEAELNKIKEQDLGNEEINELIARLENKISEMRNVGQPPLTMKEKLEGSFQSIADAAKSGNVPMANSLIESAMKYFSAPDVPVLIIISRQGNIVDYDKPTTIFKYLHFLKDQKENRNNVDSYQLDAAGKIKELDLIKK
jgi:hypothetical protein